LEVEGLGLGVRIREGQEGVAGGRVEEVRLSELWPWRNGEEFEVMTEGLEEGSVCWFNREEKEMAEGG
jgi:hypothetical protein